MFKYKLGEPSQESVLATYAVLAVFVAIACVWGELSKRWNKLKEKERPIDDRMKDLLKDIPTNVSSRFFDADEASRMDYNLPQGSEWNHSASIIRFISHG